METIVNDTVKAFTMYVVSEADLDANKVDIYDYDLDRIYFNCGGDDYNIRIWDVDNERILSYTVFKMIDDGDGTGHGEEIFYGENYIFSEN